MVSYAFKFSSYFGHSISFAYARAANNEQLTEIIETFICHKLDYKDYKHGDI